MIEGLTQLTQPLIQPPWVAEPLRSAAQVLWQGALLAALLALLLRLVPDARSRLRYRAALTALVCLPLLFVLNLTLPSALPAPTLVVGAVTRGEAGGVAEGMKRSSQAVLEQLPLFLIPAVRFVTSWAALVAAYLLAVAVLSSRLAAQLHYLRRLRRTAVPGDAALQARVRALVVRSGSHAGSPSAPQLAFSERVDTVVVLGWRAPLILLPTPIEEQLTPAQLDGVLLHELAHVRAHDYAVNFGQLLVETIFCFHPAVWWLSGVVRQEREGRCDDLAARGCGSRRDYAEALLALERARAQPMSAPALAGTNGDLGARIGRLFGLRARRGSAKGFVTLTFALGLALGIGLAQPHLPVAPAPNPGGALRSEERVRLEAEAGELGEENEERAANAALPGEPTPAECADRGGRWFHMGMAGLVMEPEASGDDYGSDDYGDEDGAQTGSEALVQPTEDFFIETPAVVYRGRCALAPGAE